MKKIIIFLSLILFIGSVPMKLMADEGMWLPLLIERLNQRNLQEMGLQLTPEEIYSVNNSSLKDAIVSMGGFCTGEIISENGLMLTNHHCGYDQIRANSTVENDYLTEGFWAGSYDEELPNPGLYVSFLVRMEDVTNQILPQLEGVESEDERNAKIAELSRSIASAAEEGTHYEAEVNGFYEGNEFYLFVYESFEDVRLVGAPPSSVGKYGGDTDNWMWPRQTGDFSLFRVYAGPDGKPAPYSPDNKPLKPKHFLPVSIAGVEDGDFTMTFGYPGSTDRYLSSWGIEQAIEKTNPTIVEIRRAKLDVLKEDMDASDAVRIKYAAKYAQIANYWKYYIGQTEQLKANNVKAKKEALEKKFQMWAKNPKLVDKYGDALTMIEEGTKMKDNTVIGGTYVLEGGLLGADAILFTYRMGRQLEAYMGMETGGNKTAFKDQLKIAAAEFFEEANMSTDKKIFAVTTDLYSKNVATDQLPTFIAENKKKYDGKWMSYADKVYDKSIFTDLNRLTEFIEKPDQKSLDKDPMLGVATDYFEVYQGQAAMNKQANDMLAKGNRLFQDGLRKLMPTKDFYPDANSTMRASFGNIASYNPKDGVEYLHYTTFDGVMEKYDPTDDEFQVPQRLIDLHKERDYGQYADEDGNLRVNFISTNDITGGNSGSPVINGKGELIGLAFDGNWEAMSGDINFEKSIQRTISVDIRYVLFIIDKYAGASHLVDEMSLVRERTVENTAAQNKASQNKVEANSMNAAKPAEEKNMTK